MRTTCVHDSAILYIVHRCNLSGDDKLAFYITCQKCNCTISCALSLSLWTRSWSYMNIHMYTCSALFLWSRLLLCILYNVIWQFFWDSIFGLNMHPISRWVVNRYKEHVGYTQPNPMSSITSCSSRGWFQGKGHESCKRVTWFMRAPKSRGSWRSPGWHTHTYTHSLSLTHTRERHCDEKRVYWKQ